MPTILILVLVQIWRQITSVLAPAAASVSPAAYLLKVNIST